MARKKKGRAELDYGLPPWRRLAARHGGRMFVVSRGDWERVRTTAKRFPEAYEALKALDVLLTEVDVRDGRGRVPRDPGRRSGCAVRIPG